MSILSQSMQALSRMIAATAEPVNDGTLQKARFFAMEALDGGQILAARIRAVRTSMLKLEDDWSSELYELEEVARALEGGEPS